MKTILPIILGLIFLFGCGPSKEQQQSIQAAEKAKIDSVIKATAYNIRLKDSIMRKRHSDSLDALFQAAAAEGAVQANIEYQAELKNRSAILKAQLAAAEASLESINQWQLGRTQAEKIRQIEEVTLQIELLKNEIMDVEKQIE